MAKDYEQLWKTFAGETDKAQAVRSLVEILADKEGRTFISGLDSEGAGLCIETLGNVSRDLHLLYSTSDNSPGYHRPQH